MSKLHTIKSFFVVSFLAVTSLCSAAPSTTVNTPKTITWGILDFAPSHIVSGPHKGTGKVDKILKLMQSKMPGYDHREVVMNTIRIDHEIKSNNNVCGTTAIKTPEREAFAVFSMTDDFVPSHRIIYRKDSTKPFPKNQPLSLQSIIDNKALKGGFVRRRSYTHAVDTILRAHEEDDHLYFHTSQNINKELVYMLIAGRIDYTLEYPWMASYIARDRNYHEAFATIELTELKPYVMGHFYCPDTPWGREVIKQINAILLQARPTQQYRDFIESHMDASSVAILRHYYDSMFLKHTQ